MNIREAKLKDASAIAHVHVSSWQTTYTGILPTNYIQRQSYQKRDRHWKNLLNLSTDVETDCFVYVAENTAQEIIGFIAGGWERSNSHANQTYRGEIYALYLLKDYQKHGIGRTLVQTLTTKLLQSGIVSILVWVLADNPAVEFYQSLGGQEIAQKLIKINEIEFAEIAYGWNDTQTIFIH